MLNDEISRAKRHEHVFSFLFIDIDDFKNINDSYGHMIGDRVLLKITKIFYESLRTHDIVGRFAGDEFSIILPETDLNHGLRVAEKICKKISKEKFFTAQGVYFQCTVSIGITAFPQAEKTLRGLLSKADKALYRAKKMGKNHVCS